MSRLRPILTTIHTAALGTWLGCVLMTGAAAAVTFPAVKALSPTTPVYSAYTGDHWMLVAGHVAARVFYINDIAQFICAALVILTTAGLFLHDKTYFRGRIPALRLAILSGAFGFFCFYFFVLSPRMSAGLHDYWQAAQAGDNTRAATFKAAFDADHPLASNTLSAIAVTLLAAIVLAAWHHGSESSSAVPQAASPRTASKARLEVPALLKSGAGGAKP
ncbi:MAG: hypothetical protein ACREJO_00035 [Phycisphaerales bacterium]